MKKQRLKLPIKKLKRDIEKDGFRCSEIRKLNGGCENITVYLNEKKSK